MKVADVMNHKVVSVAPELPIAKLAALLVERNISAVPVTDARGRVVGIVSEGDLMRRPETGTERQPSWWLRAFAAPDTLAERYIRTHELAAKDLMTRNVVTIGADAPLGEAAELMETHKVKRLPVMRNGVLVGIISRADLVRALAAAAPGPAGAHDDQAVRERLEEELEKEPWARRSDLNVTVVNHVAHLWGIVASATQNEAMQVLARRVPGVRDVKSHLTIRPPGAIPPL